MLAKNGRNRKKGSSKELIFSIFFAILFLGLVGVLIVANLKINDRRREMTDKIGQLKEEIKVLEEKNQNLNKEVSDAGSLEQLEKVAREQLGLKKPGEEVVVVKDESQKLEESIQAGEDVLDTPQTAGFLSGIWKWLTGR